MDQQVIDGIRSRYDVLYNTLGPYLSEEEVGQLDIAISTMECCNISVLNRTLNYAFSWSETPQGYGYWATIWHEVINLARQPVNHFHQSHLVMRDGVISAADEYPKSPPQEGWQPDQAREDIMDITRSMI